MRNIFKTGLAALMFGLLSTACVDSLKPLETEREKTLEVISNTVLFTATIEQGEPDTRTVLDGLNVVWCAGDQIRIFNANTPAGAVFTLASGEGTATGTFTGSDIGAGPYFAIYPASTATFTGTELKVDVPEKQEYAANSFGNGANISWAKGDARGNLRFRNACGAVSFTLTGSSTIKRVNLHTRGSELLNGTLTISGLDSETPSFSVQDAQADEGNRRLWLDCGAAGVPLTSEGVTFILSAPVGALSDGFIAEFVDADGMTMIMFAKGSSANSVERSVIRKMPAFAYVPKFNYKFISEAQNFSAYSTAHGPSAVRQCEYDPGRSQYSFVNDPSGNGRRDIRFHDWTDGYSLKLKISPKDFSVGNTLAVELDALGNTGSIVSKSGQMSVVKILGDRAWIFDSETGNGYVILMEE